MSIIKKGRPCCYHCGKQLFMYKGEVIYAKYTDPIGNEHKLHKDCYKYNGYALKQITATWKQ
jgi:hypothetical protein